MKVIDKFFNRIIEGALKELTPEDAKLIEDHLTGITGDITELETKLGTKATLHYTELGIEALATDQDLLESLKIGDIIYTESDEHIYSVVDRDDLFIEIEGYYTSYYDDTRRYLEISRTFYMRETNEVPFELSNDDSFIGTINFPIETGTKLYKHAIEIIGTDDSSNPVEIYVNVYSAIPDDLTQVTSFDTAISCNDFDEAQLGVSGVVSEFYIETTTSQGTKVHISVLTSSGLFSATISTSNMTDFTDTVTPL